MAKRFHDTGIWGEDWFLELDPEYMMFWLFIKDKCDHAGIWKPNKRLVAYITHKRIRLEKALERFNSGKERVRVLTNGRWLLTDFVSFQYGPWLNLRNRVHASIAKVLEENGVQVELLRGIKGIRRETADEADGGRKEDSVDPPAPPSSNGFAKRRTEYFWELWKRYPRKVGRKAAEKHFEASVKTEEDLIAVCLALDHYLASTRVYKGYVQNGSTFFNNWRDWVNYTEPICPRCKGNGKFISSTGYENICTCEAGKRVSG